MPLALLAMFAVLPVFGQDLAAKYDVGLKRSGFTRFSVAGQKFSYRDAGKYIDDAETIGRIMKGIKMEKAALGLGVSGAALIGVGFGLMFGSPFPPPGSWFPDLRIYAPEGLIMSCLGGAFGLTAIAVGAKGAVITKKAVRTYNADAGYRSELRFGMAATPGGLGLQLTF